MFRRRDRMMAVLLVATFVEATMAQGQPPAYIAVNLGTMNGMDSWAYDISNEGTVVGFMQVSASGPARAFEFDNGTFTDLGGYFGGSSRAFAINEVGTIVGQAQFSLASGWTGFQISQNTATNLYANRATDMNRYGDFVGNTSSFSGNRAYIVSNGVFTDVHSAIYGSDSYANGVNCNEQVVGYFLSYTSGNHAYIYDHGTLTDLAPMIGGQSWAYGINDYGVVVGYTDTNGGEAFIYANGVAQFLGHWQARGINNWGSVVGSGYLFDGSGSYELLNLLDTNEGWTEIQAFAINDYGEIVGYGYLNGLQRAVLLIPLPEPSSLALFAAGLLAVNSRGRQRQES